MSVEQFKFLKNYMNNDIYRKSFSELAISTFGINFDEWYKEGYLGENYINYSYLYEEKVVANISVNKFNIIYNGKVKNAIQLGTVMTHKNYRNKRLIKKLMNIVLKEYEECDLIYLFANDTVLDFYPKFGFKRVIEGKYEMDPEQISQAQLNNDAIIKLDLNKEEHIQIVKRLQEDRFPVSQKLGIINDKCLLDLYCNCEYIEDLYYITEDDVIVIFRREDDIVKIYDILSKGKFNLDKIISKVIRKNDKKIQFGFIPESSNYKIEFELEDKSDCALFVKEGKEKLKDGILFPETSHT